TLFIELPSDADTYRELHRLVGLDEHVVLRIGDHSLRAVFESGRSTNDKISAVQYVRFALTAESKAALRTPGTPLTLLIDHPNYQRELAVPEETRASLAADYEGT